MSESILRRYTNLPSLIFLLREKKISLLDPQFWDDKNDSYYLSVYKEKRKLNSVLALCFTQVAERYDHWRVFTDGSSGICIKFRRDQLLKAVNKEKGTTARSVEYLTLEQIREKKPSVEELPFLKRYAFQNEKEFRIIFESKKQSLHKLDVPISLSCIEGILLSPWLATDLRDHVMETIRLIEGCLSLTITRSSLIDSDEWKRLGDKAD